VCDCSTWNNFVLNELGALVRWEMCVLRWVSDAHLLLPDIRFRQKFEEVERQATGSEEGRAPLTLRRIWRGLASWSSGGRANCGMPW
jgi:hypothetical protein